MSLLILDRVSKRYARGRRGGQQHVALRGVSLEVGAGEIVAVWGPARSGRTTLLQVAAGITPPSDGVVRFDGENLARREALGVRGGIAFASTRFRRVLGQSVLEHVAAPLVGRSCSILGAQSRAFQMLNRVEAVACADLDAEDLDHEEAVRVGLARALVTEPRLLLVDEPTVGVPPARGRDAMLALLRSLAHRDEISILMTVGDAAGLAGVNRALSIDNGEVRGETRCEPARVIALRPDRSESSA